MSRKRRGRCNTRTLNARLDTELDAELIAWLDAQPHGRRSEAIRGLMRDGLRMSQFQGSFASIVRQAVAEALDGVQLTDAQRASIPEANEVEESLGGKLDQMLGGFG